MGGNNHGELILDAIDQLRKRKARPDLDRISHMLQRRHGLSKTEVNEKLSDMVDRGIVMKVDYKGNTSYRNAAKWVRTKSLFKPDFSSSDMAIAVQEAVDAISHPGEPGNATVRCASLHDIEKYLLKRDTMCNMNIATLRSTLEREVTNGNIRQVRTGEYVSVNRNPLDSPIKAEKISRSGDDIDENCKSVIVRKRPRCDYACPKVRHIPKDSPGNVQCTYCLLRPGKNRGKPEGLLVCKDCSIKAHPRCIGYTGSAVERVMACIWLCTECKRCAVCLEERDYDPERDAMLVVCRYCDKAYHTFCHRPLVSGNLDMIGNWTCNSCLHKHFWKSDGSEVENSTLTDTDMLVPMSFSENLQKKELATAAVFEKCLGEYPNVVPVVDSWSIEEVETFIKHLGYHNEASAFKAQEIDGQSLLLMKRSDVLTGLSIKLGPALKLYQHIIKLQNVNTSDVPTLWVPD